MTVADSRRMSEADRAGLAARSPEGHAAKSMHIREGSKIEEERRLEERRGKNGMGIAGGENYMKEWESIRRMGIIGGKP